MKISDIVLHPKIYARREFLLKYLVIPFFRFRAKFFPRKAILYSGQSYYHAWYLSRGLRQLGWTADVLNWDLNEGSQIYYHGEDFRFSEQDEASVRNQFEFYLRALWKYDIFHFSNIGGIVFGYPLQTFIAERFGKDFEISLLRRLGKKVAYSHTGCLDGVSQTKFSQWKPVSVCASCNWRNHPEVCSDEKNLAWGRYRNSIADYQCTLGGNRADYNDDPRVHEAPGFFCLDGKFWDPALPIPEKYRLDLPADSIKLYHVVGNSATRTDESGVNIKSTHIYLPLIERFRQEGYPVEHLTFSDVPNKEIRYYQMQADIVLDMLTFGFFGANGREAMMLGKPYVCFLRPEWLDSMREECPEYVDELPVVNATPETVYEVVKNLLDNPGERAEIGRRSRAFALKWHSSEEGAKRFDKIYLKLLKGDPLLRS